MRKPTDRARLATVAIVAMTVSCGRPDDGSLPFYPIDAGPHSTSTGTGAATCAPVEPPPCTPVGRPTAPVWDPENESCWRPVSFETPCKAGAVEVALQPTLAAPPLEWEPCDPPSEGCERLGNTLWKTVFAPNWQPPTYTRFSVVKTELGHRLGVRIEGNLPNLTDRWTFSVVYDEKGRASHVWRTTLRAGDDDICSLQQPLVTPSRVWMSVLHIGGDAAATTNTAFFSGAYDEVDSICDAEHFGHSDRFGGSRLA